MPPRASSKVKRGPEEWNAKKKKITPNSNQVENDFASDGPSKARPKYPPGPDMVAAVTEEFRHLPPSNSNSNSRSPAATLQVPSTIPLPDKSAGINLQSGNATRHAQSIPPTGDANTVHHDDVGIVNDMQPRQSLPMVNDTEDWLNQVKSKSPYEAGKFAADRTGSQLNDWIQSPYSTRKNNLGRKRYNSLDSEEGGRRDRKSRRGRRRRSRRSTLRSSSSSYSDYHRKDRGRDSYRAHRHWRTDSRVTRHSRRHRSEESDELEDGGSHGRQGSFGFACPSRPVSFSTPPSGQYDLRIPSSTSPVHRTGSVKGIFDQGNTGGGGGSCTLNPFTLRKDSEERNERRLRHKAREDMADRRVDAGKKRYLVHVSEDGRPYGLGVGVWNETLGKLVRGLDPSYIDIRHQPCGLMDTLIARLNEDFEYSNHVSSSFLRARIGSALSSYRHDLMKIIEASGDRPQWISEAIWFRLVTMSRSDKFKQKSEQMKYANACRKTKGRTGPIGVAGVTEKLREQLGRTPDPDEIQVELRRDKGRERRERLAMKDGVQEHSGYNPADLSTDDVVDISGQSSGPTLGGNLNSVYISVAGADGPGMPSSAASNDSAIDTNDPDIAFAREHPLGKVVLKQMAELRNIPGCNTPELKMILDGLMLQIRSMRKNAESNRYGIPERPGTMPTDTVTPVGFEDEEDVPGATMGHMSCPMDSEVSPSAEPPVSEAMPTEIPTVTTCCYPSRKSMRVPRKKNLEF